MHLAKFFGFGWALAALGLAVTGCSGSDNDDDEGNRITEGRGTESCRRWQNAICDWAERCGASSAEVAQCEAQAPAISCTSDDAANTCADSLASASCTTSPTGCDLFDLADPVPAVNMCNDFLQTLCERQEECEPGTLQTCLDEVSLSLDCNTALGVKLSYEDCLAETATLSCTATALPAPCLAVIITG